MSPAGRTATGTGDVAESARIIEEDDAVAGFPGVVHPEWAERWPWLTQGVTASGPDGSFDLGLAGKMPVGHVLDRWRTLSRSLGFGAAVQARQVHGIRVLQHVGRFDGLLLAGPADGHATLQPDLLLTVTVADCVPAFIVAADARAIALLHAGWRGTAAGIMEAGLAALVNAVGQWPGDVHVHLGPSICGRCYEVGPEVHRALGRVTPPGPEPVDLRHVLFQRAVAAGVDPDAITASNACTRCRPDRFFSHRAGSVGRQVGWLGLVAR